MLTVYILECSNGSYYTGVTNNIERRINEHSIGLDINCYTFDKRPIKLVFQNSFESEIEAINWEKKIKGWRREKKEALINGTLHLLPLLSKSKINSKLNQYSDPSTGSG